MTSLFPPVPKYSNGTKKSRNVSLWVFRGVWAIADQGLFACSNFIAGVLLARWLSPADFGLYSIGFATFLFVGTLHTALLTEPMMVFGSSRYEHTFLEYLNTLLRIHWRVTVVTSFSLCLIVGLLDAVLHLNIAKTALSVCVATPCILFVWLLRRSCYVVNRPETAARGGVVYIVAMMTGFAALHATGLISVGTAFYVLAASSLAAGGLILKLLSDRPLGIPVSATGVVSAHWIFGRWSLLSNGLNWFPANWYLYALPLWGTLGESAHWRAAMNLIMPIAQANSAIGVVALPLLVRKRSNQREFRTALLSTFFILVVGAGAYAMVLMTFGSWIMQVLYGGKYSLVDINLFWLSMFPVADASTVALGAALRANEQTPELAVINFIVAALTVTIGSILAARLGIAGALYGSVSSTAIAGCCMFWVAQKMRSRSSIAGI